MKANFSFLQSALNLRSWFTLSLQSAASRLNVVLLRELAVVLHLVKLLLCFFHQLQDVLIQLQGNANFLPVFLQELEQTWTSLLNTASLLATRSDLAAEACNSCEANE